MFDSVLRTFSPVNQRVIKYRILGYGAGEICAILAEQNIDMNGQSRRCYLLQLQEKVAQEYGTGRIGE